MTTPSRCAPWVILFALVLIHVRDAESQYSYGYGDYYDYGYYGDTYTPYFANSTTNGTTMNGTTNSTASPPPICTMTPTWFPEGYENAASPDPLQYYSQVDAGWDGLRDPLRVALSHSAPKFYLGAKWFLSTVGEVPMECTDALLDNLTSCADATAGTRSTGHRLLQFARRLLQLAADDEAATVLTPATYAVTWRLNQGPPTSLGTFKAGDRRGPPIIDMKEIYADLPDGSYCVQADITALSRSAVVAVKGVTHHLPCSNITRTTQFCFAKVVRAPYTKVKYSSCSTNFTADFSGITPSSQSIYTPTSRFGAPSSDYSSSPSPSYNSTGYYYDDYDSSGNSTGGGYDPSYNEATLFSVILHLYGNATGRINDNRTGDSLPPDEFLDTRLEMTDPLQTAATFNTDQLRDGQYTFYVEMLLKTSYPTLLDLPGAIYNDDGTITYHDVLVNGSKGESVTINHNPSDLFGLACPADQVVALPVERTFQWESLGGGALNCFVDGLMKNNAEEGCSSPYTLNLRDTRNHTLKVVLTNVCGDSIIRSFTFSAYGCIVDSDMPGPALAPPPPPSGPPPSNNSSPALAPPPPPSGPPPNNSSCSNIVPLWGPCGGRNGPTNDFSSPDAEWEGFCCDASSYCKRQEGNPWYWQCIPVPEAPVAAPVPEQPTPSTPSGCAHSVPKWGACGGKNGPANDGAGPDAAWAGFCCAPGSSCQEQEGNVWYWQCL